MDNLTTLKDQIKVLLEATEDTELIKSLASIQNTVSSVEEDQAQLMNKNQELAKSYKDAIIHGGYTTKPAEDTTGTKVVDFDNMLEEFLRGK